MLLNLDTYNAEVKQWAADINGQFKSNAARLSIVHRDNSPSPGPSINKFRNRFFSRDGGIVRIGITFPRTLIYTHKGAGKGRGGSKGSRWVDKYGNSKTTSPESKGKMGTGGRVAKPFINDALESDKGINKLAEIVAVNLGDSITGNLFIK